METTADGVYIGGPEVGDRQISLPNGEELGHTHTICLTIITKSLSPATGIPQRYRIIDIGESAKPQLLSHYFGAHASIQYSIAYAFNHGGVFSFWESAQLPRIGQRSTAGGVEALTIITGEGLRGVQGESAFTLSAPRLFPRQPGAILICWITGVLGLDQPKEEDILSGTDLIYDR